MSGARTEADDIAVTPTGRSGHDDVDLPETEPAHEDTLVRGLSMSIGGPLGEHAVRRTRRWDQMGAPAVVILILTMLTLGVHWFQKYPCHTGGAWDENWNQYARFCYSDIIPLYHGEGLGDGKLPYRDHPVEYPVLTGAMMGIIGLPVNAYAEAHPGTDEAGMFYQLNALVLGAFAIVTAAVIIALRRRRPWDAAMFAIAPAMFFTVTVNWDFLAIGLTALFFLAWARRRPVIAGVLLGLAAAAKFWPLFLAGPMILLAIRSARWRHTAMCVGTGALTWAVINGPVWYLWPDGWYRFFELSTERPIDWGTLWFILTNIPIGQGEKGIEPFLSLGADIPLLNTVYQLLFVACCVGIAVLTFAAKRRPRFGQLAFLVVVAFLLTSKVWSQQFGLWLIPLAILARPRWVAFLIWQMAEVFYFLAFYGLMLNMSGRRVYDDWVFELAATLRWATALALAICVVKDILRPENDVVRHTYEDDPDGGEFDGAPDNRALYGRRTGPPPDDPGSLFGPPDTGPPEAGPPDAGPPDAGPPGPGDPAGSPGPDGSPKDREPVPV